VSSQKASLEDEIRQQRNRLEEADSAMTQLELTRRALEGELQRSKMTSIEQESKIRVRFTRYIMLVTVMSLRSLQYSMHDACHCDVTEITSYLIDHFYA